ncbi:uncharacterized protein LOC128893428 isoform X2 [Hylaeus anthracinus]|uniref:uncharacterized protein LOC128893428 isoform X2 n=1 Tax=Hylaeus anthracinus TaxID=313031 RepID=UPI0023B916E8|nr:uncharacterized protein LOC128893428 isoform X2 [Hylaeus anthracinus]
MGNNGSSSRDEHAVSMCSNGLPGSETSRGWSQSFPRELGRHRSQQPTAARKVLPEPPNQRLRATDNGSIIHNGGTISGRRPPAFASSRDLSKHDAPFRGRSTSASNVVESRSRRIERHCRRYQSDASHQELSLELKRFGSEPDLRYSPDTSSSLQDRTNPGKLADGDEGRSSGYRRGDRDAKERVESRYKARKKYKAPAPPTLLELANNPQNGDPRCARDFDARCRFEREVQPPPRRSRLFKTRAESKKAQVSWQLSGLNRAFDRERGRGREPSDRIHDCRNDTSHLHDGPSHQVKADPRRGNETLTAVEWQDRERIRRSDDHRQRSKLFDGKNTLQRSMSSPEFQAELIQVARKVRDKLDFTGNESTTEFRSLDRRLEVSLNSMGDRQFEEGRERAEKSPERRVSRDSNERVSMKSRSGSGKWVEERFNAEIKAEGPSSPDRDEVRKPLRERRESKVADRRRRANENGKHGKRNEDYVGVVGRNAVEASSTRGSKDARETRGWAAGRASTPETQERKAGDKENSDPRWWNGDAASNRRKQLPEEKWPAIVPPEKPETKLGPAFPEEGKILEERRREDDQFLSSAQSAPKTFYFGMNEILTSESRNDAHHRKEDTRNKFQDRDDGRSSVETADDTDDNSGRNVVEDISLKLRPTLPKKQLEIPRFSPSAAWRLLSALEAPGPSMSTASEEIPVMFEERIERLSRPPPPPPPLLALGPRSLHDKSGDSGISGDAGAANDDSLDVSTINRVKAPATRPTWTPQQDLGEESSSDAGVDSPPPLPTPLKYPPRAHVFSLSLPREDARTYLCAPETKPREGSTFNSLKKLKRSVSGAFGIGDIHRKSAPDVLDDNWFLSTSAPTSLQHNQVVEVTRVSTSVWRPFVGRERSTENGDDPEENVDKIDDDEEEDDIDGAEDEDEEVDAEGDDEVEEDAGDEVLSQSKFNDFPVIMKAPSFSYLTPGGHVMYLPESNEAEHRVLSLNGRKIAPTGQEDVTIREKTCSKETGNGNDRVSSTKRRSKNSRSCNGGVASSRTTGESSSFVERYENTGEAKQRRHSSPCDRTPKREPSPESKERKPQPKNKSKSRRFTFQSTVRQIERRRLAEKLSREAEAKERQRKGELEAMRKVEEEFQRKRAKEKANIRQQLRLFKEMEENFNSLPPVEWDGSQLSRAEPDGAPSSTASSPTWQPAGKSTSTPGKNLEASSEFHRHREPGSGSGSASDSKHRRSEQTSYRPKYYDWAPDTSSNLEYKQTTVHPKIVCDIPKSSPVFVDVNVHPGKPVTSNSTPRSDNYRKDFAHGAMIARSSFASSDSELSQPNTRPHSRETGVKSKTHRSRF